jgi:RNA polymerase sigma factor (TIGR02999 family)
MMRAFSRQIDVMAAGQITECLARWRAGDRHALERLVPLVYDELRHVARRQLRRESPDHTLSATALVHEVYLRLLRQRQLAASDRDGFLAIAAQTMRRILVDHARARARVKRGGKDRPIALDDRHDVALLTDAEAEEVLAIDLALERLAQVDERALRVVECRIFAGLTLEETAQALGISGKSVQRTWTTALAWLRKEVGRDPTAGRR